MFADYVFYCIYVLIIRTGKLVHIISVDLKFLYFDLLDVRESCLLCQTRRK